MKVCSKCKRDLPLEAFSRSPRYICGRYSSCKECQKAVTNRCLEKNRTCTKCNQRPHESGNPWCYQCRRISEGKSPEPKWRQKKAIDRNFCPVCQIRPPLDYHRYCQICKNAATRKCAAKKRGVRFRGESLRKKSARHYINTLFKRGKIRRQPCEFCGEPSQHFHHLSYEDRSTNIQHVCFRCHVLLEREKRNRLTEQWWVM
jgi:hypothetical protein